MFDLAKQPGASVHIEGGDTEINVFDLASFKKYLNGELKLFLHVWRGLDLIYGRQHPLGQIDVLPKEMPVPANCKKVVDKMRQQQDYKPVIRKENEGIVKVALLMKQSDATASELMFNGSKHLDVLIGKRSELDAIIRE